MIVLRKFQEDAGQSYIGNLAKGITRSMFVIPTGCGKTITALALAKRMRARTLWLAHREELIHQAIQSLKIVWPEVRAGVVKAERNEWGRDFVFASVQTACRPNRLEKLSGFDLVVVDEAHHAAAQSYQTILEHVGCLYGGATPLLGLTATPERTDLLQLDSTFQDVAYMLQLREAVEQGLLVDVEIYQRKIDVNLDGVSIRNGDFAVEELDRALIEGGIVNSVATSINELARDLKTIIFTVSVKQAEMIAEELRSHGLRADSVSGATPKDARRRKLRQYASGEITHMANCMVLTEGFDEPSIECVVMARPTKSKPNYIQCAGRGIRRHPNKTCCRLIDLVGLTKHHSLIQAPVIFGLEPEIRENESRNGSGDDLLREEYNRKILLSQISGVGSVFSSKLRWIQTSNGLALSCGQGGTIMMRQHGSDDWIVEVHGRDGSSGKEVLVLAPVSLELAQGIAEDYVRRAQAVYLTNKSAKWREAPATDKQLQALKKLKVRHHSGITKGEASDLITHASASDWRHDRATERQMIALERQGVAFDPITLTKGEAGRLLSAVRK